MQDKIDEIKDFIVTFLDGRKAENLLAINIEKKSNLAKYIILANGTSRKHVSSMAEQLADMLKNEKYIDSHIEGIAVGEWVLLDLGPIIVNIFYPEARQYINLEEKWK